MKILIPNYIYHWIKANARAALCYQRLFYSCCSFDIIFADLTETNFQFVFVFLSASKTINALDIPHDVSFYSQQLSFPKHLISYIF